MAVVDILIKFGLRLDCSLTYEHQLRHNSLSLLHLQCRRTSGLGTLVLSEKVIFRLRRLRELLACWRPQLVRRHGVRHDAALDPYLRIRLIRSIECRSYNTEIRREILLPLLDLLWRLTRKTYVRDSIIVVL